MDDESLYCAWGSCFAGELLILVPSRVYIHGAIIRRSWDIYLYLCLGIFWWQSAKGRRLGTGITYIPWSFSFCPLFWYFKVWTMTTMTMRDRMRDTRMPNTPPTVEPSWTPLLWISESACEHILLIHDDSKYNDIMQLYTLTYIPKQSLSAVCITLHSNRERCMGHYIQGISIYSEH